MFTEKEHRGAFEFSDELASRVDSSDDMEPDQRYEATGNDLLLSTSEKDESRALETNGSSYTAPDYSNTTSLMGSYAQAESNLSMVQTGLAIDDLLGLSLSSAPAPPVLKLNPKAILDAGTFQRKWGQLHVSLSQVLLCLSPFL